MASRTSVLLATTYISSSSQPCGNLVLWLSTKLCRTIRPGPRLYSWTTIKQTQTPSFACRNISTQSPLIHYNFGVKSIEIPSTILNMSVSKRWLSDGSSATAAGGKEGETKIKSVLSKSFPSATSVIVEDISGGCGSMYQVFIETKEFEGLSIVKQHQLVNKALKDEIKDMHGIRIQTQIPKT